MAHFHSPRTRNWVLGPILFFERSANVVTHNVNSNGAFEAHFQMSKCQTTYISVDPLGVSKDFRFCNISSFLTPKLRPKLRKRTHFWKPCFEIGPYGALHLKLCIQRPVHPVHRSHLLVVIQLHHSPPTRAPRARDSPKRAIGGNVVSEAIHWHAPAFELFRLPLSD